MIDKDLSHIHLLRASGYFDRSSVMKDLQRCLTDTDKTFKRLLSAMHVRETQDEDGLEEVEVSDFFVIWN